MNPKNFTKKNLGVYLWICFGVLILSFAIFGFYFWVTTAPINGFKQKILTTLPFPAIVINGQTIYAKTYLQEKAVYAKASNSGSVNQQNQSNFDQQYLKMIVKNEEIAQLLKNLNIFTTTQQIDREFQKLNQPQSDNSQNLFSASLKASGLSDSEYKTYILKPQLDLANLELWYFSQKNLNQSSYQLAQNLQQQIQNGADFSILASQDSMDLGSKKIGGDLGFLQAASLLPELQAGVEALNIGQTQIFPSRLGIHVIELVEKDNNGISGAERVHLKQIFLTSNGFDGWLQDNLKNSKIKILINF